MSSGFRAEGLEGVIGVRWGLGLQGLWGPWVIRAFWALGASGWGPEMFDLGSRIEGWLRCWGLARSACMARGLKIFSC